MKTSRIAAFIAMAMALAFALGACNTVQGVGKDMKKAGEKIEDSAKK